MAQRGRTRDAARPAAKQAGNRTIGILALQGAFAEHERRFERLGCPCIELRKASDLEQSFDRLVLPGGESTVQAKLLRDLGMIEALRGRIAAGMPVLATCAGLILLAERIEGASGESAGSRSLAASARPSVVSSEGFGTLPVTVRRNAYGRQLGSFHTHAAFAGAGIVPMTFIRAPLVTEVGEGVEVLARVDGAIVAVRHGNQIGVAFHPELDDDDRVLEMFLALGNAEGR